MLKNINCNEETIYIGYLHDIIEDTKYSYDDLLNKYGKYIADGVLQLSEDQSIADYIERKIKFINNLKQANDNILIVELADKLQNLISDYSLYLEKGRNSLVTECNNFDELKWYYTELKNLFNERISSNSLLDRYNEIVALYFN